MQFIMISDNTYKERLSAAITWLRFPLIFLIIMLHSYSVVRLEGSRQVYFEAIYPFSLWLGETGVPGFFYISGFLFFLSKKSYGQKLTTRIHTLFIPYLLWNSLLLALYLIAYAAGYSQNINYRSITEYQLTDYIRLFWDRGSWDNGNFVPLLCPFWYIRNLLIMSIVSPLLYYVIRYGRSFPIGVTIMVDDFVPQCFYSADNFILQSWSCFSILGFNPLKIVTHFKTCFLALFILFAVSDFATHSIISSPWSLQIHRLALIFNIPALILLADYCVRGSYSLPLLSRAAFIVFAVHYPIVVMLRKWCASRYAMASDHTHILLYFFCVIITTVISIVIYMALEKFFPKLKNILSGNR